MGDLNAWQGRGPLPCAGLSPGTHTRGSAAATGLGPALPKLVVGQGQAGAGLGQMGLDGTPGGLPRELGARESLSERDAEPNGQARGPAHTPRKEERFGGAQVTGSGRENLLAVPAGSSDHGAPPCSSSSQPSCEGMSLALLHRGGH